MKPQKFWNKSIEKSVALAVAVLFVLEVCIPGRGLANTASSIDAHQANNFQSLKSLTIPAELGSVEEKFQSGSSPLTVLYVQDAHAVPQAQQSISKLIQFFGTKYGVRQVALEGAKGKLDFTFLESFPDKSKLKKLLDQSLSTGELSGAVAAQVLNQTSIESFGVEDWKLYEDGVSAFLLALRQKEKENINARFETMIGELDSIKKKFYSAKALELDGKIQAWRKNPQDLHALLKYFSNTNAMLVSSENYPSVKGIFQTLKLESVKNNEDLRQELKDLASEMKPLLHNAQKAREFNQKLQGFQTEQISQADFATFLNGLASLLKKSRQGKEPSVLLKEVIASHELMSKLQGPVFAKEFESYLHDVKTKVFLSDDERKIDALNHFFDLLRKFIDLELSSAEWAELSGIKNLNLETEGPLSELSKKAMSFLSNDSFNFFRDFYKTTHARDLAFIKNIKALAAQKNTRALLFVTGGFHAEGLKDSFKKEGISFVQIQPRMDAVPEHSHYQDYMKGNVSWKNYFQVKNGKIDLQDAFCRSAIDQLLALQNGNAGTRIVGNVQSEEALLKTWRDEIVKTTFAQGHIAEAGRYTHFIDEKISHTGENEKIQHLKSQWSGNLEKFIQDLQHLEKENSLTENHIAQLLTHTNIHPYAIPQQATPAWWVYPELRTEQGARAELRMAKAKVDLASVIQAPARFRRDQIATDPKLRARLRAHFLGNAVGVRNSGLGRKRAGISQVRGIDFREVAAETGALPATVGYWSTGKWNDARKIHQLPTIGWEKATKLALFLLPEETDSYQAVARTLGIPDLTRAEIEQIFPGARIDLATVIQAPARFRRDQIATDPKLRARLRAHFLGNAVGVRNSGLGRERAGISQAREIDFREIALATEALRATVGYWSTGKWNDARKIHQLPTIGWEKATKLALFLLPEETDSYQAVAKTLGISDLTRTEIEQIFRVRRVETPASPSTPPPALARISSPATSIEAPGRWFNRAAINNGMIKQAKAHFLTNAFRLVDLKEISDNEILTATGARSTGTLDYWRNGKGGKRSGEYESPAISWDKASRLAILALGDETDPYRAVARVFGVSDLTRAEIEQIFPGARVNLASVIQAPARFRRDQIATDAALRARLRAHFLGNAVGVNDSRLSRKRDGLAQARGIDFREIAAETRVLRETVKYWSTGKWNTNRGVHELPTISWEKASRLAVLVLGNGMDEYNAVARVLGIPDLSRAEIEQIFPGARNGVGGDDLDPVIRGLDDWLAERDGFLNEKETAQAARQLFLANAMRVADLRGISVDQMSRATKASAGTVGYWKNGKSNEIFTSISLDYARPLARRLLRDRRAGDNDFHAIARLIGNEDLSRADIEGIFERARAGRSELRENAFLTDLNNARWNEVGHDAKHALLYFFFTEVLQNELQIDFRQLIHMPLPQIKQIFNRPFINNQSLISLYDYYEKEAKNHEYASTLGFMLYDAGFRDYDGYEDIVRHAQLEKNINADQRDMFNKSVAKEFHLDDWLDLFETHQQSLYYFLSTLYPQMDPGNSGALLALLSEKFLEHEKRTVRKDYPIESLRSMEADFEFFVRQSKPELMEILLFQIRQRISDNLVEKAKEDFKGKVSLATIALQKAVRWFDQRLKEKTQPVPPQARVIYENLKNYYQEILDANYQGLVNSKDDKGKPVPPLNLYQLEGIHFASKGNILLGDEMGVGKTVQALGVAQATKAKKVIIVASKTVLEKWSNEILKWLPNTVKAEEAVPGDQRDQIAVIRAGKRGGLTRLDRLRHAKSTARFILINYEALHHKERDQIIEELNSWDADLKIGDEAHRFRNTTTLETDGYLQLKAKQIKNLTGTLPVNKLKDAYPVLHDLDPVAFPSEQDFEIRFRDVRGRIRLNIEMNKRGILLRRLKKYVLSDLEKLHDIEPREVPLSKKQREVYQQAEIDFVKNIDRKQNLKFLNRMRKAAIDLDFWEGNNPDHKDPALRRDYQHEAPLRHQAIVAEALEILAKDPSSKIVIFSEFKHPLNRLYRMLREKINENSISFMRDTDTPTQRLGKANDFNTNPSTRIFLSTTGIGGEGIDLVGGNYVFIVDPPYTHARIMQAIERLHRPGQTREVHPILFKAVGTWEDQMLAIIEAKKTLKDEVMDGMLNANRTAAESNAAQIQRRLRQVHKMLKILAELQSIYMTAKVLGNWRRAQVQWNRFAAAYSENVEKLAAFPIAQIIFLFLFDLHRRGEIQIKKGDRWRFSPAGPATDLRAMHTLEKLMSEKIGFTMKDFEFTLDDFAEEMIEEGKKALRELGVQAVWHNTNLVEDELPPNQEDWVTGSELWHYGNTLNSKGVSQRNWMLFQLMRNLKVGGHGIFWVHSGVMTENAQAFLEGNFGGKVLYRGTLKLDTLPKTKQEILSNMSFVLVEKVKETDIPLEDLRKLPKDGFEIKTRGRATVTRPTEIIEVIPLITLGPSSTSASILPFAEMGGKVIPENSKPLDEEMSEIEKKLLASRDRVIELLGNPNPNIQIAKRIREEVEGMLLLDPKETFLKGIFELIRLTFKQNSSWKDFQSELKLAMGKVKQRLDILEQGQRKLVPQKPKKLGGKERKKPEVDEKPKQVPRNIIRSGDLLQFFVEKGFQFKQAKPGTPFFSSDVRLDEERKVFWVNSDLVDFFSSPEKQEILGELLNLKAYMHLDALFPANRLEAAIVGLDRLQKRVVSMKMANRDLKLLENIDFRYPDLFFFTMQARSLQAVPAKVSEFSKNVKAFQKFLEEHRNSGILLPFEKALKQKTKDEIQQLLKTELGESQEQTWIDDFLTRHSDKFKSILDKGYVDLVTEMPVNGDDVAEGTSTSIELVQPDGKRIKLADRKPDASLDSTDDSWVLNWKETEFPQWVGKYQRQKQLAQFGITRLGKASASSLVPSIKPESIRDGIIIANSSETEQTPLLLRQLSPQWVGVFRLTEDGNLAADRNKPEFTIDLGQNGGKVLTVEHAAIEVRDGKIRISRNPQVLGTSLVFRGAFEPARAELRTVTELASGLVLSNPKSVQRASRFTARAVKAKGLAPVAQGLRRTLSRLLLDETFVRKVAGLSNEQELSYGELDQILKNQNWSKSRFDAGVQIIFNDSLGKLSEAIKNKEITKLAPIIFYNPEMKRELGQFVRAVSEAVQSGNELKPEDFKTHIVFSRKKDMMDFLLSLKTSERPFVEHYSVDETSGLKEVSRALETRVIKNPKFSDSFGVFFPQESWTGQNVSVPRQRLVQSEIPAQYSGALIPKLALYFAQTTTGNISAVSLLQALPDMGASLEFRPDTGIHILVSMLELMAKSQEKFAISA